MNNKTTKKVIDSFFKRLNKMVKQATCEVCGANDCFGQHVLLGAEERVLSGGNETCRSGKGIVFTMRVCAKCGNVKLFHPKKELDELENEH